MSVNSQNSKLTEEYLLPMLVILDRNSGEIITQIFNFVDHFPSKQQINLENLEKLLRIREILEPSSAQTKPFENKKEEIEHILTTESSFLKDSLNHDEIVSLNQFLEESEKVTEIVLDTNVNYKQCLLESFKAIQDPFDIELEDVNFDQNPNDPSQLQMNIKFIKNQNKQ